jgi:amidase
MNRRRFLRMSAAAAAAGFASRHAGAEGEIWRMSASDIAGAIRTGRFSAREAVRAHLDRIQAVNGKVNAVTRVLSEEALRAADEADRAAGRGVQLGPLHGVPMSVKENVDVTGSATTQGVRALASAVPSLDHPSIAQLRKAGAIPIARTNLPDFGLRWHTESDLHGATINPWDRGRTPGGSSGGDAAALATGMTPLGNGNDYGGSLRWPAQCCGITSIRPSRGRVPSASALAPGDPPLTVQMFAVEGPMARRVADVRLALLSMIGRDARDPWWTPAPFTGPEIPKPIRVAVTSSPGGGSVHGDVAAGVSAAARALEKAGYAVEEIDPPAVEEAAMLWSSLVSADIRTALWSPIQGMVSPGAREFMQEFLTRLPETDLNGYVQGLAARNDIARRWSLFFEGHPLVLGPVSTEPPFRVGLDLEGPDACYGIFLSMRLVVTVNLLGLPAAAVPVGVANGLPQGVQIIGPMYREDLCLDAAEAIENALGTLTPIDPR